MQGWERGTEQYMYAQRPAPREIGVGKQNGGWQLSRRRGLNFIGGCFIQGALILWWETDKGTLRVSRVLWRSQRCCGVDCQPIYPSCLVPAAHQQSEEALK